MRRTKTNFLDSNMNWHPTNQLDDFYFTILQKDIKIRSDFKKVLNDIKNSKYTKEDTLDQHETDKTTG